jgi:hypothetical protein
MDKAITRDLLPQILKALEKKIGRDQLPQVHLLVGGGGALVSAYLYPLSTTDVDAISLGGELSQIEKQIAEVAKEFNLPSDWINPYFSAYTIYLPKDYKKRVVSIYQGKFLMADALGPEDLLIMKLMAGRKKDEPHIRFLLKKSPDLNVVEKRLEELKKLYPKVASSALELFDEVTGDL